MTMMTTADMAMRSWIPIYGPISKRFHENPDEFADAFARAWFKLTHRDMGPRSRYLGEEAPEEELLWQDNVPAVDHDLVDDGDISGLKANILASGLSGIRIGFDGLGIGFDFPGVRYARRRQWRTYPSGAAEGLGSQ